MWCTKGDVSNEPRRGDSSGVRVEHGRRDRVYKGTAFGWFSQHCEMNESKFGNLIKTCRFRDGKSSSLKMAKSISSQGSCARRLERDRCDTVQKCLSNCAWVHGKGGETDFIRISMVFLCPMSPMYSIPNVRLVGPHHTKLMIDLLMFSWPQKSSDLTRRYGEDVVVEAHWCEP